MVIRYYPTCKPKIGDTLAYIMHPDDLPINASRLWHGTVLRILVDVNDRSQRRSYLVQSHEYQACTELVDSRQIVSFFIPSTTTTIK
ncbi:MAG: hypothetical protein ABI234_08420 [Ktedonobacteraceae bacterium]